jgi:UrcA family protein
MRIRTTALLLVTCSIGLAFAESASAAPCGTYGGYDPSVAPSERVIVTAPRIRADRNYLNVPFQSVSLSATVHFADLDLCTGSGARALRERVRAAAKDVCDQLAGAYPYPMQGSPSCYHDAMANAQPKVDFAIGDVRGTR